MHRFKLIFGLLSALSVSACASTLKVENVEFKDLKPVTGFRYALPLTQFNIQLTRRVTACANTATGADLRDPNNLYVPNGHLIFSNEIEVKPVVVDDMDAMFVIDPRSISTYFNRASFSIEYHKGTRRIKTVNATVEDQLAPAIISIAKSAAGLGSVAKATGGGGDQLTCVDGLHEKVKIANEAGQEVAEAANALKLTNAEIKRIKLAQAKLLPSQSQVLANDLSNQLEIQADQVEAVRLASAKYAIASKDVKIKHSPMTWPRRSSEYELEDQFVPSLEQLSRLAEFTPAEEDDYPTEAQKLQFEVDLSIVPECGVVTHRLLQSFAQCGIDDPGLAANPAMKSSTMGIYYREPAPGRLVITSESPTDEGRIAIHNKRYEISQLGFIDSLPVKAQPFESIEFSAEFAADGRLVKGGYKDTAAPAVAIGQVVETLSEIEDAQRAERDAELAADVARLENQKKLAEAQLALTSENREAAAYLASLQTTLATVQAEQAIAEAEQTGEGGE